jgi:PAS domain S-box-containing protein
VSDRLVSRRTAVELRPSILGLALLWTLIIACVLFLEYRETQRVALDTALTQAVAEINKDDTYRKWISQKGGVYVPVTRDTPANPYLLQIPERDITTPLGKQLTLMNAAYVLRQVHELANTSYGAKGHLTSPNPLRPENGPDAWEANALQQFSPEKPVVSSVVNNEGQTFLRYMRPLYVEDTCLKCHAVQGYKVGELRGGISITLPMRPMLALAAHQFTFASAILTALWLLGLAGIVFSLNSIGKRITERERSESKSRESAEQYNAVLNTTPDGFMILHTSGKILEVNDTYCMMSGYTYDELLGMAIDSIDASDASEENRAQRLQVFAEGSGRFETKHKTKTGAVLEMEVSATLMRGSQCLICFIRDITERKRSSEALRESEERYRNLFENMDQGVVYQDKEGRITAANPAAQRILGLTLDQMLSRTSMDPRWQAQSEDGRELSGEEHPSSVALRTGQTVRGKLMRVFNPYDNSQRWLVVGAEPQFRAGHDGVYQVFSTFTDITDLKLVESELLESACLLRDSQAIGRIGSYREDIIAGTWTSSQALDAIFGISDDYDKTVAGWASLIHPEYAQQMVEYITRIQSHHERFDKVYKITRQSDGQERWVHGLGELEYDEQGNAIRMIGTIQDITERKVAEDALRESEQFLRAVLEASPLGVSVRTRSGRLLVCNKAWQQIWGVTDADVELELQRECPTLIDQMEDEEHARRWQAIKRVFDEQGPQFIPDLRVTNPRAGAAAWVAQYYYGIKSENGGADRIVIITQDITARKEAEQRLYLLATAIEQAAEGFVIADAQGLIVFANPAVATITGISHSDMLWNHITDLATQLDLGAVTAEIFSARAAGRTWSNQISAKRPDGSIYEAHLTVSPISGDNGRITYYTAVLRDVTHEAQVEVQLRQAQKIEAIGRLAGGIAHDFNNLLFAILGNAELLRDAVEPQSTADSNLGSLTTAALRAKGLVQQILAFSRQTQVELVPLNLGLIVKEVTKLLRSTLPTTIEIKLQLEPLRALVLADATEIHQVLMNLCTNAAHAMEEHPGCMTLGLREVVLDEEQAALYIGLKPGLHVALTVADTGQGIEPEMRDRIFEPFFTTKSLGKGTGMGLAVVHGIVTKLGGAITLESRPHEGSMFTVLLPALPGESYEYTAEQRYAVHGAGRVLVVDDEPSLLDVLAQMLRSLGYSTTCCATGTEALQLFRADPSQFDLVVTDQTMPKLTGAQLATELLSLRPDLPIILCTGYSQIIPPEEAARLGICEYLYKPILKHDLAAAVRRALK